MLNNLGIFITSSKELIYDLNYKMLLDKTCQALNKWMQLPMSLISKVNIIKMTIVPKFNYLFMNIPLPLPTSFFKELSTSIKGSSGYIKYKDRYESIDFTP